MKYDINLKNIKQSASLLGKSLGAYNVPHSAILEAFSHSLYYKNYNTLQGVCTKPQLIEHYKPHKYYLFELEAGIDKATLLRLLREAFIKAKAEFHLSDFIQEKNYYHFKIDLTKSDTNILTAIFLLCDQLKSYHVSDMKYCRVLCEKESFMGYFK